MKLPLDAIHLMHEVRHATLATHSVHVPGYPYATAVPCVVDATHCPLLCISALAEHTKNLLADSRTSLAVSRLDAPDVLSVERLTVVGDAVRVALSADQIARYLRYHPEARQYLELDFLFFRLVPKGVRYIAGMGKMGWIEADTWRDVPVLEASMEASLVRELSTGLPSGIHLFGLDCLGIDYETQGRPLRHRFAGAVVPEALGDRAASIVAELR
jgi:heme oxygenase (biliverdin-IX-beta and delta-forming)